MNTPEDRTKPNPNFRNAKPGEIVGIFYIPKKLADQVRRDIKELNRRKANLVLHGEHWQEIEPDDSILGKPCK